MAYMARWGPKGFAVSPSQVIPFENFSTSVALKSDSENDTSGTAPTNTRGRELQPMEFSVTYLRAAGADPRAQIEEWETLLGQAYPLYIGEKRFGPAKMTLKKVDVADILLTIKGEFLRAVVTVTLEEYSEGKTSKLATTSTTETGSSKKSSSGSSSSSSTAKTAYDATVAKKTAEKQAALKTTASKSDKVMKVLD